jgi:hypothetical protein
VSSLSNLQALTVPCIAETSFVKPLTKLKRLSTYKNGYKTDITLALLECEVDHLDLIGLSYLVNLEDLAIQQQFEGNKILNVDCLTHLSKLDTLDFFWNQSWEPVLASCTQLKTLSIGAADSPFTITNNPSVVSVSLCKRAYSLLCRLLLAVARLSFTKVCLLLSPIV